MKNNLMTNSIIFTYILFSANTLIFSADIVVDKNKTPNVGLDKAPNGVTLININQSNQNGVSHNIFKEFNIGKDGVILNNGKDFSNSQLGGIIYGNPNLQNGKEASLILNEVSGVNKSKLEGFTEITGKKADYILANPNGIYVNGAGFINMGRVTLTTGVPVVNNFGALEGFDVETGTIVVGSSGLDTRNISKFDMIARTAELQGAVYGGEKVSMVLGRNTYDYNTEKVTAKNDDGKEKPKLALDAKSMGSLYAGRIYLKSTEKGVGVNSESTMLADVGDFVIDVNGDLVLKNAQAKQNIDLKSSNTKIKEKLLSEKSIKIKTDRIENFGDIASNEKLVIESNNVVNNKNIVSDNVDIKSSKNIENNGIMYGEKEVKLSSNNINNNADIQSKGLIDIDGNIENKKNIISEEKIDISGELKNKGNGYIYSKNSEVKGNVNNEGTITSLENIDIIGDIKNSNTLASGEKMSITGNKVENSNILSSKDVNITANDINNTGKLTSESLNIKSKKLNNSNTIYGKNKIILNVDEEITNSKLIQGTGNIDIISDKVVNEGDLFSENDLILNSSILENNGQIISDGKGTYNVNKTINKKIIQGDGLQFENVENTGSIISKKELSINSLDNTGIISGIEDITLGETINQSEGKIVSDNNISIKTSLKNDGILSAQKNITSENIENTGKILSNANIKFTELNKNQGIIEGNNIEVINKTKLDNDSGEIKVFNDDSVIKVKADEISNKEGIIGSQGTLDIELNKDLNLDEGKYIGNKEIKIKADNLISENDFESAGNIEINLNNDFRNNNRFVSGGNLDINASNMIVESSSTLGSAGKSTFSLKGIFKNLGEIIFGKGRSEVNAKEIENQGFLISNDNMEIVSDNIENSGQIASAGDLNLTSSNNIQNKENSLIFSGKDMNLTAENNIINERAEIYSNGNIEILAGNNIDNTVASIESLQNIRLEAKNINNIGELTGDYTKKVVSGSQSSIDTSKLDLTDVDRKLQEGLDHASRKSKRWTGEKYLDSAEEGVSNFVSNTSNIKSAGNIDINASNIHNKEGNITANKDINITADTLINDRDYRDIDIILNFRRDYKYKKRSHKTGHSKIYASTTTKQRLYGDKTSNITAGGNMNIIAEKIGNGEYTSGTASIDSKNPITHGLIFNDKNDIKKDGTIKVEDYMKIPEGDKGLFKINEDLISENENINLDKRTEPGFSYLIETNVKFIDKGYYLGSEYFFSRINFNPEKDIRLLGDSFYETTIVNKAIFESTRKRYLNGATSDKEQMQILYDNSIKAMEDFDLSIGVALTPEQINNLKNDIIWYVEEEVQGVKVLVPKVYLSKETLASLSDVKGNEISGGKELNISALAINNTGSLLGEKGVTIKTDNLISESLRNGAYASIEGENITIVSKNDIVNKGGSIIADENIILNTENGNIVNDTKVHINDNTYKDTVTDIVGKGVISGENIIIDSGKDFSNAGGEVLAKDTVNIKASENINLDSVETVTQKQTGSSKNYTINRKEENIGSNISGENINLEAGKNLTAIGSDVVANKDLNVKAGENINIVGSVDSESTEKHKSSSGFFKSKESIDIKYDETINVSNFISGNNMNVEAGNNINVVGSNVVSDKELNLEAGNNVVISSGLEGSSEHHESIKTGFLGLSGRYEKDKEINYKNVGSYVGATEDINIKANNNVNVIASDVESGKDINISAGKDVNIVAGDDITKKESEKHKTKTSIFGSVKDLNFEVGLKTEASKNQSTSLDTKVTGSNILAGGDVNISSNKDINIEASNIEGKNTNLHAENELNITGRDEIHSSTIKNEKEEIKITAGVDLGGIKDTVDSVVNMVESAKDLPEAVGVVKDLASGKDINESLEGKEESIEAVNNWLNGPSDGGVSAGIYAGAEISKDKSDTNITNTVGSTIISDNDVNMKTDKGDMNFERTDIYAGNDINIDSGKDINISSGKDKTDTNYSSESVNGKIDILTGQVSGGITTSKGESSEETNNNSHFYAENKIDISGKDMDIKGGNIEGEHVNIDVDNLNVESVQDKSSSSDKSINIHGSTDNERNTSTGAGVNIGKYDKEWVEDQSSIIGREDSNIKVEGNTHLEGGLLGGKDTTLDTGSLTYEDIKDHEKGTNIGINEDVSKGQKDKGSNNYTTEGSYSATNREQITHATVGDGTIIIGGKEENPEGLNRDEEKAQEITKDVHVDEIHIKHETETRDWNEVKDIMTEHGEELDKTFDKIYTALGKKYEYNLSEKFDEVWNELELVVGKDLKQDIIGLIPTERNNGGIFEQSITKAEGELQNQKMIKVGENPDGSFIVDVTIDTPNGEVTKRGTFANGMLNYEDTVGVSGANQSLPPEIRNALSNGETVEFTTYTNPSHGAIGDLAEIVTDLTGYYTDGKIMTGNAKKLADKIRKNPDILIDYTAHSQGTITSANAIIDIINSGDGDILKGKKIRFNGSPLQLDKMEKLSKEYGFEFEHVDNMRDPITNIIGTNKPNSENEGHSTSGNESNKGYSKYQKYNKNEKIYKTEVSDKDFHNVDEIRKVNGKDTNSKTSQKLKEIKNKIFDKKEGKK